MLLIYRLACNNMLADNLKDIKKICLTEIWLNENSNVFFRQTKHSRANLLTKVINIYLIQFLQLSTRNYNIREGVRKQIEILKIRYP